MANLPHGALAVVDIGKIEDYCLNPTHPRGRHKARVFRDALGLAREDADWLREALLAAAEFSDATSLIRDLWGAQWRVDAQMTRHNRTAVVRSIWIIRTGEYFPWFVSCWVL
jgi:hypothetical protein